MDPAEAEARKKRMERFGQVGASAPPKPVDPEEEERRKKRMERFAAAASAE